MEKLTAEMYVEIFKDVMRDNNDYSDKNKVRKHNAAHTKIAKLIKEIQDDKRYLEELFGSLLLNEDDKIKLSVATKCLELNVLSDKAIECLNSLKTSNLLSGIDKMGIGITLDRYKNNKELKGKILC